MIAATDTFSETAPLHAALFFVLYVLKSFFKLFAPSLLLLLESWTPTEHLLVVLESPRLVELVLDRERFRGPLLLLASAETVEPLPLLRLGVPGSLGYRKLLIHRHC